MDHLKIYSDPEILAKSVSQQLMEWIAKSPATNFHLAISGGSTPNLLFQELAERYADSDLWQKTHFWWVDERMVESGDPESNYGTAQRLLFSRISIPERNIHPIHGALEPSREAAYYSAEIAGSVPMKNGWPRFDLVLLGMGEDGHTASIFPGSLALLKAEHICEVAIHPATRQLRITLTGEVINRAATVCFLVTGHAKAERLREIRSEDEKGRSLPAFGIRPASGELYWFADQGAANLLHGPLL